MRKLKHLKVGFCGSVWVLAPMVLPWIVITQGSKGILVTPLEVE